MQGQSRLVDVVELGGKSSRLAVLLGFLSSDPSNLNLIADAADAALSESQLDEAQALIDRYRSHADLPPSLQNIAGLVAMRQRRLDEAAATFDTLLSAGVTDPSVRFNRAWVHALMNEHEAVLSLLDADAVAVTPRAAALRVQAFHHLGQLDEALAEGKALTERFPGNDALLGALSVAAMDADDYALAKQYAETAQGGSDALTTRGLVALNDDDPAGAIDLFDRALAEHPEAPRAWLGKGLGLLSAGNADAAVSCLEKGAQIFEDHLGSWIALGWTHFVRKDMNAARAAFEEALRHDDNFAETHGALAVMDLVDNQIDSARRRADIALRLDKECFGGILARTLLLEMDGKPELAAKIRDRAMNMPMSVDGKTLAQAMAGLGFSHGAGGSSS
jgi:tetratricopeptide (TPR) repeat protein